MHEYKITTYRRSEERVTARTLQDAGDRAKAIIANRNFAAGTTAYILSEVEEIKDAKNR